MSLIMLAWCKTIVTIVLHQALNYNLTVALTQSSRTRNFVMYRSVDRKNVSCTSTLHKDYTHVVSFQSHKKCGRSFLNKRILLYADSLTADQLTKCLTESDSCTPHLKLSLYGYKIHLRVLKIGNNVQSCSCKFHN